MDKDFDRYLAMVDPLIVQTQVVEALNEDADLADKVEEELANEFMRQLEEPAYQRQVIKSSQIYAALMAAQRECRMRIEADGSARATWLTVQLEADQEVTLFVGIG